MGRWSPSVKNEELRCRIESDDIGIASRVLGPFEFICDTPATPAPAPRCLAVT